MRVRSPYSLRSIGSVYPRGFGREKSYNALENMLLKLATIPFSPTLLKFTRYHALLIIVNLFASFTHVTSYLWSTLHKKITFIAIMLPSNPSIPNSLAHGALQTPQAAFALQFFSYSLHGYIIRPIPGSPAVSAHQGFLASQELMTLYHPLAPLAP